jgi:hypothetical protein
MVPVPVLVRSTAATVHSSASVRVPPTRSVRVEFLLPGVALVALALVWVAGWRRQRVATSDLERLIADLEGEHVEVEFVVSLAPGGRSARITAIAEARVAGLRRRRGRWVLQVADPKVEDTVLAGTVIADGDEVQAWIDREGIALVDVISITTPSGERHPFYPEPRRRR